MPKISTIAAKLPAKDRQKVVKEAKRKFKAPRKRQASLYLVRWLSHLSQKTAVERLQWSGPDAAKILFVAGNESADQDRAAPFREVVKHAYGLGVRVNYECLHVCLRLWPLKSSGPTVQILCITDPFDLTIWELQLTFWACR